MRPALKFVYKRNAPNETKIPTLDTIVMGTENTMDVTTMANNLLIQFKAACNTTDIRLNK